MAKISQQKHKNLFKFLISEFTSISRHCSQAGRILFRKTSNVSLTQYRDTVIQGTYCDIDFNLMKWTFVCIVSVP